MFKGQFLYFFNFYSLVMFKFVVDDGYITFYEPNM